MQLENQTQTPQTEFLNHEVNPPKKSSPLIWAIVLIVILLVFLIGGYAVVAKFYKISKAPVVEEPTLQKEKKHFESGLTLTSIDQIIKDDFIKFSFHLVLSDDLSKVIEEKTPPYAENYFYLNLYDPNTQKNIWMPFLLRTDSSKEFNVIESGIEKNKPYDFTASAIVPLDVSNGSYLAKIQYAHEVHGLGLDFEGVEAFLESPAKEIKVDRTLSEKAELEVKQVYPEKDQAWLTNNYTPGTYIPFLRFSIKPIDNSEITLRAFELIGNGGKDSLPVDRLTVFNSATGEKLSDLINLGNSKSFSDYALIKNRSHFLPYFLEKPIKISNQETMELELRGTLLNIPESISTLREDIRFYFYKIDAISSSGAQIIEPVELFPIATLYSGRQVKTEIISPLDLEVISDPILTVRWKMLFPSSLLEKLDGKLNEWAGFEIFICEEIAIKSCRVLVSVEDLLEFHTVGEKFQYDKLMNFEYNWNLVEGKKEEEHVYRKPVPNGKYTLVLQPRILKRTYDDGPDDPFYYFDALPVRFRKEINLIIQR